MPQQLQQLRDACTFGHGAEFAVDDDMDSGFGKGVKHLARNLGDDAELFQRFLLKKPAIPFMSSTILIVNGPNLNMLGRREPQIYGSESLNDIERLCREAALRLGFSAECFQSNEEGAILAKLHSALEGKYAGIIINAGAYTHTSIAILDALSMLSVPVIEVHLSNIFRREPFRHESYVSKAAAGVICGFGAFGYALAFDAMRRLVEGTANGKDHA